MEVYNHSLDKTNPMNRPTRPLYDGQRLKDYPQTIAEELRRASLQMNKYVDHLENKIAQLEKDHERQVDYLETKIERWYISNVSNEQHWEAREKQLLGEIEQLKEQLNEAKHAQKDFFKA